MFLYYFYLTWNFQVAKRDGDSSAGNWFSAFFSNIDKFSRLKGTFKDASLEAELKTAVDKAYAAIEQLKDLGLSLSRPIVDELAISGRILRYIYLKYKLESVAEIAETLKELGASDNEIEDVYATIYSRVINDHTRRILLSLENVNPEKGQLFEGINDAKMDGWSKDKIEKFVEEHNLIQSDETKESIIDLDYFLEHKKLRREDKWQS